MPPRASGYHVDAPTTPPSGLLLRHDDEVPAVDADQDEAPRVVDERAAEAIATIGAELMRQAEERGWCTEYDEVISALNERLPEEYRLPRRERRHAATFTVTETITRHVTLGGRAHSAEEFRERVTGITDLTVIRDLYCAYGTTEQEWNNLARSQVTVTLG